jgi:transcriptional regulator with XRE-family HTH domain
MENFGRNLNIIRTYRGLKQQEVADKLKVGRNTVSDYETGRSQPNLEMLVKISDYYGVDTDVLLKTDLVDVQAIDETVLRPKSLESTGKSTDFSTGNKSKTPVLKEDPAPYGTSALERVIGIQMHTIDSQKALIDSLNEQIRYLKEKEKMN